jgi:AraC-like DNA-binding protein
MPLAVPPAVASFRFSTDDVPAAARGAAVHLLRERGLLPLEPLADHAVHVRIAKWFLPGAGILSGSLVGLRQEAAARAQGITDDLFFTVNLTGRSTVVRGRREIAFGDGEAVLLSCADGDFVVDRREPTRFIGIRMPRKHLAPLIPGIDDRTMRVVPGGANPVKLLTGYLAGLADLQDLLSPETSRVIAGHVHDLVALSIAPTRDAAVSAEASVRAARLWTIKADVVGSLEDCTLSPAAVAARHRVTPRYVHKLFESDGTTFTRFLTEQRLDRAYRMLRDERLLSRTITSIAYDVGFNDLSHFNRAFRRRYHATPSDVRAAPWLDPAKDD